MFTLLQTKRFERCLEPFAGSASWSLAAMEIGLANKYVINDSDKALINTHQLIRDAPELVKRNYISLVSEYNQAISKLDFYLEKINAYNNFKNLHEKTLLLIMHGAA